MSNEKLYIGCHVGLGGPDYYEATVKEALEYGCNTFMFYTGAPQNSKRMPLDRMNIEAGREILKKHNIDETKIVVHAPYIMNLGNTIRDDLFDISVQFLRTEMERVAAFGAKILVMHPGAHVGAGSEVAIDQIVRGLNLVLDTDTTGTIIAIETMAGKGSEVGSTFEQVADIVNRVHNQNQIGVCLDTCHISDGNYDVHDVDMVLSEFDRIIGLKRLKAIHVNDSKNPRGAAKDRHENVGYGTIGFATLNKYIHHPLLQEIPKILETPYIGEKPPYKVEIAMFKNGTYIPNWREQF